MQASSSSRSPTSCGLPPLAACMHACVHRAREDDRERLRRNGEMHRQPKQAEHCRRKATGKGNADQQMQVGRQPARQPEKAAGRRLRPDGCCCTCSCRLAAAGRALQQWFGGVHADVKGLRLGCRCRAWFPPLPCFAESFLISDSIDRSISACCGCEPVKHASCCRKYFDRKGAAAVSADPRAMKAT
jgi:hypothetical protein